MTAVWWMLLVLATAAPAQVHTSARQVTVDTRLSTDRIVAGSTAQIAVVLHIQEGWHINSNRPTYDYLIGTAFGLRPREGMIISDIRYPMGNQVKLDFAESALEVYEGTITIFTSVRFSEKVPRGVDTLRGTLEVQACNDQVCLPPSVIDVDIPVEIVDSGTPVTPVNRDIFSSYDPDRFVSGAGRNELAATFEEKGTLVFFLAIFVIGLALNLTPCVYPMLSVTVSLFGSQAETNVARVFVKAVVYVLGIATMYSVLGVTAALGGGLFGSWLQSPWVLGGIAALLFALALSSFGLYQIQMPYWLTSKLGGTTGTGLIAVYLSGLVVAVFAAPCIGPPVIALMAFVGTKGDPVFGFWAFFALSLGLGFPYLILGTFSGLLKKIPRSGTWLVWVERVFGVILTGAALFYLLLAVAPKYSAYAAPFVLIVGGLYLGFIDESGKGKKGLRRVQWIFGTACIVLGVVFVRGLREPGIVWEPFSDQRLLDARENGMPVLMDFYAEWCIPCLELDRNTWTDTEVVKATKDIVRLKVDLTRFDSPESDALRKRFNISGVPTIVVLRSDGTEAVESRVVGFVPPGEFLSKLKPVLNPGS